MSSNSSRSGALLFTAKWSGAAGQEERKYSSTERKSNASPGSDGAQQQTKGKTAVGATSDTINSTASGNNTGTSSVKHSSSPLAPHPTGDAASMRISPMQQKKTLRPSSSQIETPSNAEQPNGKVPLVRTSSTPVSSTSNSLLKQTPTSGRNANAESGARPPPLQTTTPKSTTAGAGSRSITVLSSPPNSGAQQQLWASLNLDPLLIQHASGLHRVIHDVQQLKEKFQTFATQLLHTTKAGSSLTHHLSSLYKVDNRPASIDHLNTAHAHMQSVGLSFFSSRFKNEVLNLFDDWLEDAESVLTQLGMVQKTRHELDGLQDATEKLFLQKVEAPVWDAAAELAMRKKIEAAKEKLASACIIYDGQRRGVEKSMRFLLDQRAELFHQVVSALMEYEYRFFRDFAAHAAGFVTSYPFDPRPPVREFAADEPFTASKSSESASALLLTLPYFQWTSAQREAYQAAGIDEGPSVRALRKSVAEQGGAKDVAVSPPATEVSGAWENEAAQWTTDQLRAAERAAALAAAEAAEARAKSNRRALLRAKEAKCAAESWTEFDVPPSRLLRFAKRRVELFKKRIEREERGERRPPPRKLRRQENQEDEEFKHVFAPGGKIEAVADAVAQHEIGGMQNEDDARKAAKRERKRLRKQRKAAAAAKRAGRRKAGLDSDSEATGSSDEETPRAQQVSKEKSPSTAATVPSAASSHPNLSPPPLLASSASLPEASPVPTAAKSTPLPPSPTGTGSTTSISPESDVFVSPEPLTDAAPPPPPPQQQQQQQVVPSTSASPLLLHSSPLSAADAAALAPPTALDPPLPIVVEGSGEDLSAAIQKQATAAVEMNLPAKLLPSPAPDRTLHPALWDAVPLTRIKGSIWGKILVEGVKFNDETDELEEKFGISQEQAQIFSTAFQADKFIEVYLAEEKADRKTREEAKRSAMASAEAGIGLSIASSPAPGSAKAGGAGKVKEPKDKFAHMRTLDGSIYVPPTPDSSFPAPPIPGFGAKQWYFSSQILSKVLHPLSPLDVLVAIYKCDDKVLTPNRVQGLLKIMPKEEQRQTVLETARLRVTSTNSQALAPLEQLMVFLSVQTNPSLNLRLNCLHFQVEFGSLAYHIESTLGVLEKCCAEIKKSANLRTLLNILLNHGNFMNVSNRILPAYGFSLEFLTKLRRIRMSSLNGGNTASTLLDFLVYHLSTHYSGLGFHSFSPTSFPHLQKAIDVDEWLLSMEMRYISEEATKIKQMNDEDEVRRERRWQLLEDPNSKRASADAYFSFFLFACFSTRSRIALCLLPIPRPQSRVRLLRRRLCVPPPPRYPSLSAPFLRALRDSRPTYNRGAQCCVTNTGKSKRMYSIYAGIYALSQERSPPHRSLPL
jgi:hypothetical protein